MKKYGVIMAGGGGMRFWPLSRQRKPKQLLNLTGKDMMVNEMIDRLAYTVDKKDIFIVTNEEQVDLMRQVTSGRICADNVFVEPMAKNTAACIGYAAAEIMARFGDGIMVIVPSDAYIRDNAAFSRALAEAVNVAEHEDKLVIIGIEPTFPSTGYGYIKCRKSEDSDAIEAVAFHEKPDEETAKRYIQGHDLWNSGMFIWKVSTILEKYRKYVPSIYESVMQIKGSINTQQERQTVQQMYEGMEKISVDYAVIEPSAANGEVRVIKGEFDWNDLGSWDKLSVVHAPDKNGNVLVGDVVSMGNTDSVIFSSGRTVAVLGVDNLVVVETGDAVLVCPKDRVQDVKSIVDTLTAAGREELL